MAQSNAHEQARAVGEASQRTVEAATAATRQTTEQGLQVSRQVFDAWATGAEATLRATFEMQNATLAAGRSVAGANQTALEQLETAIRQAQVAMLQAFQANVRQARELGERFTPGETQGP